MNQFRDLTICALMLLGFSLAVSSPDSWTWADRGGPYVVESLRFLGETKPWSIVVMFALALALFMTRLKY